MLQEEWESGGSIIMVRSLITGRLGAGAEDCYWEHIFGAEIHLWGSWQQGQNTEWEIQYPPKLETKFTL